MNEQASMTMTVNGREVRFSPGDTVLEVAEREGLSIPTLCHDPRLDPAGACRTCLVEIEGWRRMAPSCATPAASGMEVTTESAKIDRHRKSLMALYLADHPEGFVGSELGAPSEVYEMAARYDAPANLPKMGTNRADRPGDENPYILFDATKCISCARCTRYCEEVEGVSAITLAGRGSETTIATMDGLSLLDTTCELCGGCIDTCPTGAMAEKIPLLAAAPPERDLIKVRTTCNYCGVGCQMDLNVDPAGNDGKGKVVKISSPPPGTTTNDGNLCVKGRFAYDFIDHEDRLTTPLIRDEAGELRPATWAEALKRAAQGLMGVAERHGKDSLGFVSSSRCTMEENYLVQKLSRAVFGTNNVHQCAAT
jgi:predicted molibdopterin-dependent oxidoreductase YjgC